MMSHAQSRSSSKTNGEYTLVPTNDTNGQENGVENGVQQDQYAPAVKSVEEGGLEAMPPAYKYSGAGVPGVDNSCYGRWMEGKFTIIPEDNPFIDMWDIVVIVALCSTAVLLPYEVALITNPPIKLYILDKTIDLIFCVDMIFNFNVAYTTSDSGAHAAYERSPIKIAKNYMAVPFSNNLQSGWFWPDLLTVIPWEVLGSVNGLKTVRLVRVLRLIRMLRLVRVMKLFRRWHTHTGFAFALVKVVRTTMSTLLLVHWLACFWAHLGKNPGDYEEGMTTSWLIEIVGDNEDVGQLSTFKIYNRSLYFCTVVLTTVGFGDITPMNDVEYIAMIFTIFVTGLTWAWVVAIVVNVINNMDIYGSTFNQTMDDLNLLMRTRSVQPSLRLRIRKHLYESQHVHRMRHQLATTTWLSASLQGELAMQSGVGEVIDCIWYLRRLQPQVLIEIALHFKPDLFSPNEYIMDQHSVTVIRKGSCMKNGKIMSRNDVIGEDMILATDYLKDTSCPRSITYLEVMTLSKDGLMSVCMKYPEFDQRLRKAQVKLALWRAFTRTAARIRREKEKQDRLDPVKQEAEKNKRKSGWDQNFFGRRNSKEMVAELHAVQTQKNDPNKPLDASSVVEIEKVGWARHSSEPAGKGGVSKQLIEDINALKSLVDTSNRAMDIGMQKLGDVERVFEDHKADSKQRFERLERRFEQIEKWAKACQENYDLNGKSPMGAARSPSSWGWGNSKSRMNM